MRMQGRLDLSKITEKSAAAIDWSMLGSSDTNPEPKYGFAPITWHRMDTADY
jgi:hypothetical protein